MKIYEEWCARVKDEELLAELTNMRGDSALIEDSFYCELKFATAGLRGVLGAGTNRMNIYTVRKATDGFAKYLLTRSKNPSMAISYDSRIKSELFAKEAARVLSGNGVRVHLTKTLTPTPFLSFCVRSLKCDGGIMITASHNPAKYNGYKAYGADGCQMREEAAAEVLKFSGECDMFALNPPSFEDALMQGMISYVGDNVYEQYMEKVLSESIMPVGEGLKLVYTPLNGTGNIPVRDVLKRVGITDVSVVPEQENPDGNFTTCPSPNPEIKGALSLALKLGEQVGADLILATDPDADRVGIAVPDGEGYTLMSGNEVGVLLLDYILTARQEKGTLPEKPILMKSIVTTGLADAVAAANGVEVINLLTGFKYIGEQLSLLEEKGEEGRFILGFEESYGYLAGAHVRDKDAVVACMLIAEMTGYYKGKGVTLAQQLKRIYDKYGFYLHAIDNFSFEGAAGMESMNTIMRSLRQSPPREIGGLSVLSFADYEAGKRVNLQIGEEAEISLPRSDVLQFDLEGGAQAIVRPSGTEPKIKVYLTATGADKNAAAAVCKRVSDELKLKIKAD